MENVEPKFFDVRKVIEEVPDAHIYMFVGERTGGKTYSSLSYCLDRYVEDRSRFVYVRRLNESIRLQFMRNLFTGNIKTGDVDNHLKQFGYYGLQFFSSAFYPLVEGTKNKLIRANEPIGYTASISTWETGKGGSIPYLGTIVFDEFLTRKTYLPNEPTLFMNLVSSLAREEDKVKILMLANTVTWDAPYFREWGLNHVENMKQGTYDVYTIGKKGMKLVLCYVEHVENRKGDIYFSFDNPRLRAMTEGTWETAEYPPIPDKLSDWGAQDPCYVQTVSGYTLKLVPMLSPDGTDVLFVWNNNKRLLERTDFGAVIDPRYKDRIVYTDYFYPVQNCRMCMLKQTDDLSKYIINCLRTGRVMYDSNETGETLNNYLKWCQQWSPIKT